MENDLFQPVGLFGERDFEVVLPEEAGIAEPRGEDLFVARDNCDTAVVGTDVRSADEMRRDVATSVAHHEIFWLMRAVSAITSSGTSR